MSEIRFDKMNSRGAIIAPERANRPFDIKKQDCPFCVGHENLTPKSVYEKSLSADETWNVRVFPNKFPAVTDKDFVKGLHEILIDCQDHDATSWASLSKKETLLIVNTLINRVKFHKAQDFVKFVQVWKNQGKVGGATVDHLHCQIMSLSQVPETIQSRIEFNRKLINEGKCYFCNLKEFHKDTFIYENESYIACANFAPRFSGEVIITSKKHIVDFENINEKEIEDLAEIIVNVQRRMEKFINLKDYNYIFNVAPKGEKEFHFSLEIVPRINTLGGFELATSFHINNHTPENIAKNLREIE